MRILLALFLLAFAAPASAQSATRASNNNNPSFTQSRHNASLTTVPE